MNKIDIEQLIERYMAGQTTLDEEERLASELRQSKNPRLEPYVRMFDFIERGCQADLTSNQQDTASAPDSSGKGTQPNRSIAHIVRWMAAGIAAATTLGVFLMAPQEETPTPKEPIATWTAEKTAHETIKEKECDIDEKEPSIQPRPVLAKSAKKHAHQNPPAQVEENIEPIIGDTEIDLSRYVAMEVEMEPEVPGMEQAELDEEELISHCVNAQLRMMELRARTIEHIATVMQQQDRQAVELLTKDMLTP